MATHSRILAWKIPRTEEPGGPQCHSVAQSLTQKQRVGAQKGLSTELSRQSMYLLEYMIHVNLANLPCKKQMFSLV